MCIGTNQSLMGIHPFISNTYYVTGGSAAKKRPAAGDGSNHRWGKEVGISNGVSIAKWANSNGTERPGIKGYRFARHFIHMCEDILGWEPVYGEIPVAIHRLKIATAADCVVRRKTDGATIVVEIKCGQNGSWDAVEPRVRLHPAVSKLGYAATPRTRALIQAALTSYAYDVEMQPDKPTLSCVVRLSNTRFGPKDSRVAHEIIFVPIDLNKAIRNDMNKRR